MSKFLFSVIMPVYNVEHYLAESIESVIHQSIGFEYIQLILINDGSTDGSGAICKEYAEKYPDHMIYLEQENLGVSAARNAGLALAEGQYINFLDSDDKWSEDAFAGACAFFEEHEDVRIAAARMTFFDAHRGQHYLNFKYEEDAVVDLKIRPDMVQSTICNLWIRRDLMEEFSFDPAMTIREDALIIAKILLKEMRYGVLKKPVYWYRKRQEASSTMDSHAMNPEDYLPVLERFHEKVFAVSEEIFGCLIPYAQYTVMYDLQFRLKKETQHPLSEEELASYKEKIISLLQRIDDNVILSQRNMTRQEMFSVLALKKGVPADELRRGLTIVRDNVYLTMDSTILRVWAAKWERRILIEKVEEHEETVDLEGRLYCLLPENQIQVLFETEQGFIASELFEREDLAKNSFFTKHDGQWLGFRVSVPHGAVRLHLILNGHEEEPWTEEGSKLMVSGQKLLLGPDPAAPKFDVFPDPFILNAMPDDKKVKVSVIIPVYNTEPYLSECLQSVMQQTLEDIEIICVDDGSTDGSPEILKSFMARDARIQVYTKENGGQSTARNLALSHSTGEYILFLDSDDFLDPDALRILYSYARYDQLDELFYGCSVVYESEDLKKDFGWYETYYRRTGMYPDVKYGKDLFVELYHNGDFKVSPCLQLLRREFLLKNGIRFFEGIIREDELFTIQCISMADKARVLDLALYHRRIRARSTMTENQNFDHAEGLIVCIREILAMAERGRFYEYQEFYLMLLNFLFSRCSGAAREISGMSRLELMDHVSSLEPEDRKIFALGVFQWQYADENTRVRVNRAKQLEIADLKAQISRAKKRNKKLTAEKNQAAAELEEALAASKKLKRRIKKLKADSAKLVEVSAENEALKAQGQKLEETIRQLEDQIRGLENEKAEALEELNQLKQTNSKLRKSGKKQTEQIQKLETKITDIKASSIWKTGRVVTWLPRKVKKMVKR